jgi:hypothetical protein
MTTVWIYVDTRYHVFANPVAADEWFKESESHRAPNHPCNAADRGIGDIGSSGGFCMDALAIGY